MNERGTCSDICVALQTKREKEYKVDSKRGVLEFGE